MVLGHALLEEVALLLQVDHLALPWKRVFLVRKQRVQADLHRAAVGDEAQVALEHGRVQAQHSAWHRILGVAVLEVDGLQEQGLQLFAELGRPQLRAFHLDRVDQVDAEIAVHRFVAQDVLVLLGGADHLVLAAQRQDLGEADVEEQAYHQAGEHDDRAQQLLVRFLGAGLQFRIVDDLDERDQELVVVADRRDPIVGVEDFLLVQAERLHDVLVGVGVDGFLEGPAQQVLAAFRRRYVAVGAQHDVVGSQRVGGHEEARVALDDAALVLGQAVRVLPQLNVALHVHSRAAADFAADLLAQI